MHAQSDKQTQTDRQKKENGYCSDLLVARVEVHDKGIMFINVKRMYQNQLGLYHNKKVKPLQSAVEYDVHVIVMILPTFTRALIIFFLMLISKCIIT